MAHGRRGGGGRTLLAISPEVSDVMYGYGYGMNGWGYAALVIQVLFWALLVVGVAFLIRYLARGRHETPAPPPAPQAHQGPEQILAGRFARGEIDEEEYHRRLTTLRSG